MNTAAISKFQWPIAGAVILLSFCSTIEQVHADGDPNQQAINSSRTATASSKAAADLANACAQHKRECPTATPTPTITPTASPTSVPPTPTVVPTDEPPIATPTATPGPPCLTDDNGDKWLVVDGELYFTEDGQPYPCPNALEEQTVDESPTEAPFVQPTLFPADQSTPVVQVVHEVVREVIYVQAPSTSTDQPTAVPEQPTETPTPTSSPTPFFTATMTPTPTVTPTATATMTSTASPVPTRRSTAVPTTVPVAKPEPVPETPKRPQRHVPPVIYYPDLPPDSRFLRPDHGQGLVTLAWDAAL